MGAYEESRYWKQPRTDRKLTRIKSVYWYIKKKGPVNTSELMDQFGVSERTIQRDIDTLMYNGLVKNHSKGKWAVTEKKVKGESNAE